MKYLFFYIALFWSGALMAQTGRINGKILDENGNSLSFANILIDGTEIGTTSDENGHFSLLDIETGIKKIVFSSVGFDKKDTTIQITSGTTITLNVRLRENYEQLQEVEIRGRRESSYKNTTSFIGTKSATLLRDVPQSISYVTKELILDQAAFRLSDVVKNMSGVNQYTFYNDITIRGHRISGQKNSGNLVNGMRSFTSFWKQQLIPHLERVEVIKGPASAIFGNASAGGTINRVTKKPLDESRQSISSTLGSFNTFRILSDFTGPMTQKKDLLYRLNLGYENSGSFRDLQYGKNLVVAPSISFLPSEKTSLNFDFVYQGSNGRLDRGQAVFGNGDLYSVPISRALNAANDYLKEESINATLSFRHEITSNLSFNAVYLRSNYREDLLEHRSANTFAALGDGTRDPEKVEMRIFIRKRNWNNNNFNSFLNYDVETGIIKHKILLGYDYFQQILEPGGSQLQARGYLSADRTRTYKSFNPANASNYALDNDGNPIPNVPHFDLTDPFANQIRDMSKYIYATNIFGQYNLYSHAAYLQDQLEVGPLKILVGVRQEYFTDVLNYTTENEEKVSQNAFIPRFGLVYAVRPDINIYGIYVQGYQPQTASVINDPNAGGPFDPLTSELIEFGSKADWFDGRLSATLAVYHLKESGALYNANDPENPDLLVQIGEEVSKGIEFDVAGRINQNLSVVANYAYNDATITQSDDESELGRQKPNAPKHAGNIWSKYIITKGNFKGIGFGLGVNFVTERYGSIIGDPDNLPVFPAYEIVDAAIYYKLDKFQIQLNANNLFNKTHWVGGYDYIRAFPGAPRNFMMTVSYTF